MKKRFVFLILIIILSASCSKTGSSSLPDHELENLPQWATQLMCKIPADVDSATFIDIETLRNDASIKKDYGFLANMFGDMTGAPSIISFDQLRHWGIFEKGAGNFLVGQFDYTVVRERLLKEGWTIDGYDGVEILEKGEASLAILENDLAILGFKASVQRVLQTIGGEHDSLYEDQQFRSLMSKLPLNGIQFEYREILQTNDTSSSSSMVFVGIVLTQEVNHTLQIASIATSSKEVNAEMVIRKMAEGLKEDAEVNWTAINVSFDSPYWKVTAKH